MADAHTPEDAPQGAAPHSWSLAALSAINPVALEGAEDGAAGVVSSEGVNVGGKRPRPEELKGSASSPTTLAPPVDKRATTRAEDAGDATGGGESAAAGNAAGGVAMGIAVESSGGVEGGASGGGAAGGCAVGSGAAGGAVGGASSGVGGSAVFGASFSRAAANAPGWGNAEGGAAWGVAAAGSNPWLFKAAAAAPTSDSAALGFGGAVTVPWPSSALGAGAAAAGGSAAAAGLSAEGDAGEGDEGSADEGNCGADGDDFYALAASLTDGAPLAVFPEGSAPLLTGEEDEVTLVQVRAKLYVAERGISGDSAWRECGVGPLRVNVRRDLARHLPPAFVSGVSLAASALGSAAVGLALARAAAEPLRVAPLAGPPARIIMRQEQHTGGKGSRLLLNAALGKDLVAVLHPQQERTVSFSAFAPAPPRMSGGAGKEHGDGGRDGGNGGSGGASDSASGCVWSVRAFLAKVGKAEHARELLTGIQEAQKLAVAEAAAAAAAAAEAPSAVPPAPGQT